MEIIQGGVIMSYYLTFVLEDRRESNHPDRGIGTPIKISSGSYRDKLSDAFFKLVLMWEQNLIKITI